MKNPPVSAGFCMSADGAQFGNDENVSFLVVARLHIVNHDKGVLI
ncbi:hypothetical protein P4T89_09205 [Bacillus nakamurai]|nr:hypothetical protein [Bacillus nakamurai]MED1227761.1 hypothetical protein [Bacillus nakamurai]